MNRFSKILALFFILNSAFCIAQVNLVPNPSFEDTLYCPTSGGDMLALQDWFNAGGSPDYYNSCANGMSSPPVGTPTNWQGYQAPIDGGSYLGLLTYCHPCSPSREYVGVQLQQSLNIGTKYFVSAYVSRSDSSDGMFDICHINNFGFKFSTVAYSYMVPVPTDNFAHMKNSSVVSDSIGWGKIFGAFVADSNYTYINLGNFYDSNNTDTSNCSSTYSFAYYYVDGVCVSADSLLCSSPISIKTNDFSIGEFRVYPNPALNTLNITTGPAQAAVVILNMLGEVIYSNYNIQSSLTIDISSFHSGIMNATVFSNNRIYHYKILKL